MLKLGGELAEDGLMSEDIMIRIGEVISNLEKKKDS